MYASVRRYTMGAGSIDTLMHHVDEEFAPATHRFAGTSRSTRAMRRWRRSASSTMRRLPTGRMNLLLSMCARISVSSS